MFFSVFAVALLAEGVDRNVLGSEKRRIRSRSPSSRRAWIEIFHTLLTEKRDLVALLAEGVDRNAMASTELVPLTCRPPRGGRG